MAGMKNATPRAIRRPGRPKVNPLPRVEQIRIAKRAQRQRDRDAGLALCQIKLRKPVADRLRQAVAIPGFDTELEKFLGDAVVEVRKYPNLKLLAWNRVDRFLTARDAFGLYERNWKFVDTKTMPDRERELIRRLTERWGRGVMNV
jgi:hypothetical protein